MKLCLNEKREKPISVLDVCRMVCKTCICDKKDRYQSSIPFPFPNFDYGNQYYQETKEGQKRYVWNRFSFLFRIVVVKNN